VREGEDNTEHREVAGEGGVGRKGGEGVDEERGEVGEKVGQTGFGQAQTKKSRGRAHDRCREGG
jgi:hypothetical protein